MQDHEIVALYFERDENAIKETQNKYGGYCQSIAMSILQNASDAEECVNDTWLKTWHSIPPQKPSVLRTYVGKITRNLSINRFRRMHRSKRNYDLLVAFEELNECIALPEDTTDHALCAYLDEFLESTPSTDRKLFVGRYWYGRSVQDMANHEQMTTNAVSQRLKRTRQRLRAFLEERGYSV